MIDDLDKSIEALLIRDLPAGFLDQVMITFATPSSDFPPASVTLPAISIFLYDIRENYEIRTSEVMRPQQNSNTQSTLSPLPVLVDFCYLITSWSDSIPTPEQDEHRILSEVMKILRRYRSLPADVLQGGLIGLDHLPRTFLLQPTKLQSIGEYWTAMGGKPKVILNYAVTVDVDLYQELEGVHLITQILGKQQNNADPEDPTIEKSRNDSQVIVVGQLLDALSNDPVIGAEINISNAVTGIKKTNTTTVSSNGYFYFTALPDGNYQLSVAESASHGSLDYPTPLSVDNNNIDLENGITILLPPKAIVGWVLDKNTRNGVIETIQGDEIVGATVNINSVPAGFSDSFICHDIKGSFYFTGLADGNYQLTIDETANYQALAAPLDVLVDNNNIDLSGLTLALIPKV